MLFLYIIIQISHKFIHNLCITTNTLHTYTHVIYTQLTATLVHPHTPQPLLYILDLL